jgi:hypothetical protein
VAEIKLPSKSPFFDEKQPGILQSKVPEKWQNLPSKALYGLETAWNTVDL